MEIIVRATNTSLSNYNKTRTPLKFYKQLFQTLKTRSPTTIFSTLTALWPTLSIK